MQNTERQLFARECALIDWRQAAKLRVFYEFYILQKHKWEYENLCWNVQMCISGRTVCVCLLMFCDTLYATTSANSLGRCKYRRVCDITLPVSVSVSVDDDHSRQPVFSVWQCRSCSCHTSFSLVICRFFSFFFWQKLFTDWYRARCACCGSL